MNQTPKTKYDEYLAGWKNRPVIAGILLLVAIIIGLGKFTEALDKIGKFASSFWSTPNPGPVQPPPVAPPKPDIDLRELAGNGECKYIFMAPIAKDRAKYGFPSEATVQFDIHPKKYDFSSMTEASVLLLKNFDINRKYNMRVVLDKTSDLYWEATVDLKTDNFYVAELVGEPREVSSSAPQGSTVGAITFRAFTENEVTRFLSLHKNVNPLPCSKAKPGLS